MSSKNIPFKIGKLTADDFDGDYAPGRSDEVTSAAHKASLAALVARTRKAADKLNKRDNEGDHIVIVLERE